MGTEITLDVGGLTLTYSKNHMGMDHGSLFQERDRKAARMEQTDLDLSAEDGDDSNLSSVSFVRPLKGVVPRLELLGFTLGRARIEYEAVVQDRLDQFDEGEATPPLMSFDDYMAFATQHPILALDNTFISGSGAASDRKARGRFADETLEDRFPHYVEGYPYSERNYFGHLVSLMHPYSVLRVLAECAANADANVLWQYGPLVEAGWADESHFFPNARRAETFLIATEGSSDAHILKHAFELLLPDVADFFRFIDVREGHPFSGTGNLVKFAEGLVKIDAHNQIIFLFDNDAEGVSAQQKLSRLTLPSNMRSLLLPSQEAFRAFLARGPDGIREVDINRRAAAIECYLDLTHGGRSPPMIIWTNYKKDTDSYQGALDDKESHVKSFLKLTSDSIASGAYDMKKIQAVLRAIVEECSAMTAAQWNPAAPSEYV